MSDSAQGASPLRGAPFTVAFMATCSVIFLAGLVSPDIQQETFLRFAQINAAVAAGEWWRLLTSALLHADLTHVAFNMWALYQFGPPLERQIGSAAFASMCTAAAVWGGAAAYLLTGPNSILVGASGAIFGLFGVWLFASYLSRQTPLGNAQFRSLLTLLGLNAVLSFVIPRISWQGHAGGLAAGLLIAATWRLLPRPAKALQRTLVATTAAALAVAVVLIA